MRALKRWGPPAWAFVNAFLFTWLMWNDTRGACWPCPFLFTVLGIGLLVGPQENIPR